MKKCKCNRCGILKPISHYYPENNAMGHRYYCKSCDKELATDYFKRNPEKNRAAFRKWWLKNKEIQRLRNKKCREKRVKSSLKAASQR